MKFAIAAAAALLLAIFVPAGAGGQTPPRSLLIVEKDTTELVIVDPSVCGLSKFYFYSLQHYLSNCKW